jgi:hypothetical protein
VALDALELVFHNRNKVLRDQEGHQKRSKVSFLFNSHHVTVIMSPYCILVQLQPRVSATKLLR